MNETDSGPFTLTGTISRSRPEIARVLVGLHSRGDAIVSQLAEQEFHSKLRHVDPAEEYIVIERSALDAANTALLARPQCTFRCSASGRHIEFVADQPVETVHAGASAIRLRFPHVVVLQHRAAQVRSPVKPHIPLRCLADAGGVASFDAYVTDLGAGGVGFLVYSPDITLEPGTVLKRCSIALPGGSPVSVDLEVRYTLPVTGEDGRRVLRSGCRLIDPPRPITEFITGLLMDSRKGS